jgi:hypothetical protein
MVEPFLSDLTWHIRTGARYSISPLAAASYIDPSSAISNVESLIEGEYKDDKTSPSFVLDDLVNWPNTGLIDLTDP